MCKFCIILDVACQGVFDRKFAQFYNDLTAGTTNTLKLWKERSPNSSYYCECCSTFQKWKLTHPQEYSKLAKHANTSIYYQSCPEEKVSVTLDGSNKVDFTGTIRALHGAPLGACTGFASTAGPHPYTCDACNSLVHGKTSSLNRKYIRSLGLKNSRFDDKRATKVGVSHKFCTPEELKVALQVRKFNQASLHSSFNKLLHDSWHNFDSAKPFVKTLITLLEDNKLSEFDFNFLSNWIGKKEKGCHFKADDQARNLAILYSNKLGEKMYTTTAPLLGLPSVRQARKIRSADIGDKFYLPGLNSWAFQTVSTRAELRPLQNGMDGTRVIRAIELYQDKYLVGKEFPPDVRLFGAQLVVADSMSQAQTFILKVREENSYAAEAYTYNLSDISGLYPDVLTGSIPEAKSGVNGEHILAQMIEVEKQCLKYKLPLVGHCTDSASNALKGLVMLASPATYSSIDTPKVFVGLPIKDYRFFAPILRPPFPSIAYPCWDHSGRTVVRNLMNDNTTLVFGKLEATRDGMQRYLTASIQDLNALKACNSGINLKYSDINPHIKQNCDATVRIISQNIIQKLAEHVPESTGTQLFLQAAVWTHEPFRNNKFGSPPQVVRSLWAGLVTWRRWRSYIKITDGLTLQNNFLSSAHYMTEELLVHAGINHQLALHYAFPNLDPKDYCLRGTGNRGIEPVHSIFRGGSSCLPITAPNLTFQEFLSKMNQVSQIHKAEHALQLIDGHSIVTSKKKRLTCSTKSTDVSRSSEEIERYVKPKKYSDFVKQLIEATKMGDEDSKRAISDLAPQMTDVLKKNKEWDYPTIAIEDSKEKPPLLADSSAQILGIALDKFDTLIEGILGPKPNSLVYPPTGHASVDVDEACANLLMDMEPIGDQQTSTEHNDLVQVVKYSQPFRERPSKDRSKRFIVNNLPFNVANSEHDVEISQFWTVHPMDKYLRSNNFFLLSNISYIVESGKPKDSSIKSNPNTKVVLNMYQYNSVTKLYTVAGRSALLLASELLHVNVTKHINKVAQGIQFDHSSISNLSDYQPYHSNIDLPPVSPTSAQISQTIDEDPYIVEKIISKRFNSHKVQYEYLVKWLGYSTSENTWELPTNIPSDILDNYEKSALISASASKDSSTVSRPGLRDRTKRRVPNRPDYIY